jgi:peptide chain release factor 2
MRAEMVNVVAAIDKSLGLLAKRLDYDTAPYRLEEFNAMIEDPSLWDDQERAQKLMRDRQILVDAIATYEGIRQDLSDNLEMIELGAAEDDEEVVKDAEEALKTLRKRQRKRNLMRFWMARRTAMIPSLRSIPALVGRRAATGP